jgi:hypothetical protein
MTNYPLMNLFWTTLWFFLFVAWITVLVRVIADVFGSSDLSGVAKAFWTLFLILLPWVGVVVYLIVRGDNMQQRHAS